ncbi:YgcG family protein [bacterium]|nr:YgcG family protein [bacterium]
MKKVSRFFLLPTMLLMGLILTGADIPYLTGRVTDNAQILSPSVRQSLTETLKAHEDRTGNQIAILTVPTIQGESIEEYAVEVFEAWKLGQQGKDNGILIVVVPNDRRMRIEVGYGLEGTLTDGTAGQIIRSIMTPRFQDGDYDGGITEGALAVINVLESGGLPDSIGEMDSEGESGILQFEGPDLPIRERILIGAFIFGIIGLFTAIGIFTPGVGWFLYFFLIPFWAMFPIIVLGSGGAFICLITYLIAFPATKLFIKNTEWYKKAKKDLRTKGRASIGGFRISSGGSGGSWSSGRSGFSSSSFSGGGGSSGGGGASGRW